jgi:uncharacterized protein YkwD
MKTLASPSLVAFVSILMGSAGCLLGPSEDGLDEGGDAGETPEGEEVPASAYCEPVSEWDADASAAEVRVVELVNEVRASGGTCGGQSFAATGSLEMNGALRCAARVHSIDMANRGFFDHINPEGESPGDRIQQAGYSYFTAGENIAAGQTSPEEVVAGWLDSPGHCMNILSPDFAEIGVGYVFAPQSAFPHYWTQTFGAR